MSTGRSYRRRKFFVKQWLQMRYMVALAASTILGGMIFGFVVQYRLEKMIRHEMYQSHSKVRSLWEVLYPDVMKTTLILFVACVVILLIIFKLFSHRINKSAAGLDAYINSVISASDPGDVKSDIAVKEFREYSLEVGDLVGSYRERWNTIADDAQEAKDICGKIRAAEGDDRKVEIVGLLEKNLTPLVRVIRRSAGRETS